MSNISEAICSKIKSTIDSWSENGIYAISFFVYSNESFEYKNYENVSMWAISYNTEDDCNGAGSLDEERWNYAFWRQDEIPIIDIDNPNEYTEMLYNWYSNTIHIKVLLSKKLLLLKPTPPLHLNIFPIHPTLFLLHQYRGNNT